MEEAANNLAILVDPLTLCTSIGMNAFGWLIRLRWLRLESKGLQNVATYTGSVGRGCLGSDLSILRVSCSKQSDLCRSTPNHPRRFATCSRAHVHTRLCTWVWKTRITALVESNDVVTKVPSITLEEGARRTPKCTAMAVPTKTLAAGRKTNAPKPSEVSLQHAARTRSGKGRKPRAQKRHAESRRSLSFLCLTPLGFAVHELTDSKEAVANMGSTSLRVRALEKENKTLKAKLEGEVEKEKQASSKAKEEAKRIADLEAAQRAQKKAEELRVRRMVLQAAGQASGVAALGAGAFAILTKGSIIASLGNLFRSFGGSSLVALGLRGNIFGVKFRVVEWDLESSPAPEGRMKTVVLRVLTVEGLKKEIAKANGLGSPSQVAQLGHWVGDFVELLPAKGYIGYLQDPCWIVWSQVQPASMGGIDIPPRVVKLLKVRERVDQREELAPILTNISAVASTLRADKPQLVSESVEESIVELLLEGDEKLLVLCDSYLSSDPEKFFRIGQKYLEKLNKKEEGLKG
uniref:Uncharacterized protein n=1 Tax=Picocystis salinarum TaxID=88271 RepID=A0A7S3XEM1_9CHLO